MNQLGRGRADIAERDRADVAQILRDDHIGPYCLQPRKLYLVDRERLLEDRANVSIDLTAASDRPQSRASQRRKTTHALREVALMRDSDEIGLGADRAHDLRRRWE